MKKKNIYLSILCLGLCFLAVGCKGGNITNSNANNVPGEEVGKLEQTQKATLEKSLLRMSTKIW